MAVTPRRFRPATSRGR